MRRFVFIVALFCCALGCPTTDVPTDDDATHHDDDADDDIDDASDSDQDGFSVQEGDCDDTNPDVFPGAEEECDWVDNDCDGLIDDDLATYLFYEDADNDGYGNAEVSFEHCSSVDGYVANDLDCDDTHAAISPLGVEVLCDGVDSNCDGLGDAFAAVLNQLEYETVADAISASADGDCVRVCPGLHAETLNIPAGADITLESWSGLLDETILDGGQANTILTIGDDARVTVRALTFSNGFSLWGSGGIDSAASMLIVDSCSFENNTCQMVDGGALWANRAEGDIGVIVESSFFTGNHALSGGGAIEATGRAVTTLSIAETHFDDNCARNHGGAVSMSGTGDADLSVSGSTFTNNTADYKGGAIDVGPWDSSSTHIQDSVFQDNTTRSGGAICVGSSDDATLTLIDSVFESNIVTADGGAVDAGARYSNVIAIDGCDFTENTANFGSVVYFGGTDSINTLDISSTTIESNNSAGSGAISCGSTTVSTSIVISGGEIWRNIHGGVGLCTDSTLQSVSVDWGSGGTDNTSFDVHTGAELFWFESNASFSCVGDGVCT